MDKICQFIIISSLLYFVGCEEELPGEAQIRKTDISNLQNKAVEVIRARLDDSNPYYRTKAIEVVSTTSLMRFMPKVEKMLADDYVPVRFAAALTIGDLKYAHSYQPLTRLVKVADENTVIGAAYALCRLGDNEYKSLIYKGLNSSDQTVRANSAMVLGKLGDPGDIDKLYELMADETASNVVVFQAAESIAKLGSRRIYENLWTLLISKHADDRMIGVRAMGALGTERARNALMTMFHDDVIEVRLATAMELGKLGNSTGAPDVEKVLTTPIPQLQQENMPSDELIEQKKKEKQGNLPSDEFNFEPQSPEELARSNVRINTLAALAIGYIDNSKLKKYLPKLIDNSQKSIQLAAAQSILLSIQAESN